MKAAVVSAGELASVESAWRARQADAWNGDPAASWEWIAAATIDAPKQRDFLLLGTPTRPVGVLEIIDVVGIRFARPVGQGLDRMAWCPGSTHDETCSALDAGQRLANIWLPSLECAVATETAACATRVHGEFLTVEDHTDWDTYFATRSRSLRKTMRGAVNRGNRGHAIEITRLEQGDTARRIGEMSYVERHGHRVDGHLFRTLPHQPLSFTARVISLLDVAGHVRTFVAYDGDTLGAYLVGVTAGRRYLAYTMAVLASCRELSLGHRLFAEAIRVAMGNGEAIDLGNGSSEFKRRWATSTYDLLDVFLGRPMLAAIARRVLVARSHLAGWTDRSPSRRRSTRRVHSG
jgi:hypothetical protein